jgi:hypothetical protein
VDSSTLEDFFEFSLCDTGLTDTEFLCFDFIGYERPESELHIEPDTREAFESSMEYLEEILTCICES